MNQVQTLKVNASESVNYMRHSNNVLVTMLALYLIISFLTLLNFNGKLDILLLHLHFNIAGRCHFCAAAPRAKRGPGASSDMTDLRFCEVQNRP